MAPLYHYTNLEGARAVLDVGYLRAQYPHRGLVRHRFPPGVYFTALTPDTDRSRLLQNNYDGFLTLVGLTDQRELEHKLDFYFEVDSEELDPERLFDNSNDVRSEWIHFGDVTLKEGCGFKVTGTCEEVSVDPPSVSAGDRQVL